MPGRLTRDPSIMIKYRGWIDSFPISTDQASGIKGFAITVHEVKELDKLTLIMDEKGQSYNVSNDEANITLPHEPALYGIALEVLDNAGNVKSARRFVMFDNSSEIKINFLKHLKVDSASPETNYTWQTHRKRSCLSWDDRYYNSYNYRCNLLRKIQKDFHGVYQGIYEQQTGILPVSGTKNVHGITSFYYSWFKENQKVSTEVAIPNFPDRKLCVDLGVKDGETHTITITSKDLMENTLSENITFYVDASVPDIEEVWLSKDGVRQLFVHNSTDLAQMVLQFKTFDSHSGLYSIEYFLGTSRGGNELAYKTLAVHTLENKVHIILLYINKVINFLYIVFNIPPMIVRQLKYQERNCHLCMYKLNQLCQSTRKFCTVCNSLVVKKFFVRTLISDFSYMFKFLYIDPVPVEICRRLKTLQKYFDN